MYGIGMLCNNFNFNSRTFGEYIRKKRNTKIRNITKINFILLLLCFSHSIRDMRQILINMKIFHTPVTMK